MKRERIRPFNKHGSYLLFVLSTFFGFWVSCTTPTDYQQMVERELASGVREDSLFMGIYLGMTHKDFYTRCWELNKQGLIRQGTRNTTVKYEMSELKDPARMEFYPSFIAGKIYEMPVTFAYHNWAPWNKHLAADVLQKDIVKLFEKWYGKGFIRVEHPQKGIAYVKVDGNRRINIVQKNDFEVVAYFTDLLVERNLEKQQ